MLASEAPRHGSHSYAATILHHKYHNGIVFGAEFKVSNAFDRSTNIPTEN